MPTDGELGWAAGFFDGEGYVGYQRSKPYPNTGRVSPMMWACVPQNSSNIEVLEAFQSIVGFGKLYGPYRNLMGKVGSTRFDLRYNAREVPALYEILKKYLKSEKTADFLRAIEQFNNHNPETTIEDIVRLTKSVGKRGRRRLENV